MDMQAVRVLEAQAPAIPCQTRSLSWYSRVVMLGATSIIIGILWDISWHRTIGRDTFWTPAHLAIYLGGLLGGMTAGWLVIRTTFLGSVENKAASVRLWGLRAPLGAWVSIWGCFAMLTSAPFDDWWHNAYGLDVKILSPPHTVLALGMWAVVLGALLLVLREQNNAPADQPAPGRWLFIYAAGVLLTMAATFLIERSFRNQQHAQPFYTMSAATYPIYLLGIARAAKFRWASSFIALVYMAIMAILVWALPLFPGQPRLGPIYNRVNHFVPLPFPLLLIFPAMAIDLLLRKVGDPSGKLRRLGLAILLGAIFLAVLIAVRWFFSKFVISRHADNWFFMGNRVWGYNVRAGDWQTRFLKKSLR